MASTALFLLLANGSGFTPVAKQGSTVLSVSSLKRLELEFVIYLGSLIRGYRECIGHWRFDLRDLGFMASWT